MIAGSRAKWLRGLYTVRWGKSKRAYKVGWLADAAMTPYAAVDQNFGAFFGQLG
jgi:hypothetical protein